MATLPDEGGELELRDYLRVLSRRRWIVAGTAFVVVATSLAVSLLQTPVYQATAQVLLQPRSTESIFDPSVVQNLTGGPQAPTEMRVVQSDPVRALVAEDLGSAPGVSVSNPNETDFLLIRAESTEPPRAVEVADAYARAYVEHRRRVAVGDLEKAADDLRDSIVEIDAQLATGEEPAAGAALAGQSTSALRQQRDFFSSRLDQIRLAIRQKTGGAQFQTPADVPTDPVRPTPQRNAVLGLVVGLLLGVGAAFLRDHLDDSVNSKDDLERALPGLVALGLVPEVPDWRDGLQGHVVAVYRAPLAGRAGMARVSAQTLDRLPAGS